MCETELIKLCLFLGIVGFITLSVIAIIKIDAYIDKRYYGGNRYKNILYWA
jgi:hypothetical protein